MNGIQREILGIFLFFLVLFSLVSLLSFHPADPSVFSDGAGPARNLFGLMGAHVSGLILGIFGTGGFWVPFALLMISYQALRRRGRNELLALLGGAVLLLVATGGFMALWRTEYSIFGASVPAGGIVGEAVRNLTFRYAGFLGAALGLFLLIVIGFVLATGLSLVDTARIVGEKLAAFAPIAGRRVRVALRAGLDRGTAFAVDLGAKLRTWFRERKAASAARTARRPIRVASRPPESLPAPEAAREVPEIPLKPKASKPATSSKAAKAPTAKKSAGQSELPFVQSTADGLPPMDFLENPEARPSSVDREYLNQQGRLLETKLEDFGVRGEVTDVIPGPVITTFEYKPASGVKINKIVNLTDDLALALRALSIRIVAPIPGRSVIGIEIPNAVRETVRFKEVCDAAPFRESTSPLTICLGKDIEGRPVVSQLDRMPHLLIAGATGTGKSVFLNALICSFLFKARPEEVKLIMIDPKRIELSAYDGIPHLITPVVTDVKKATNALYWAVREMERRYVLLSELRVRNINQFNRKAEDGARRPGTGGEDGEAGEPLEALPYVVVIIDELADLMMVASRDVEVALMRLAQMARAAGIHLILATQRPSVDVLTGVIKANFPTRLTFQVSSKIDSRTVIDTNGAEKLLGHGDMLFLPPGTARLRRIHGPYISEEELARITDFLKRQGTPEYDEAVVEASSGSADAEEEMDVDERYDDAVALVTRTRQASISMVQRHLRVGYNRAARMIEMMEREGIVGPADGAKAREVLAQGYDDMGP